VGIVETFKEQMLIVHQNELLNPGLQNLLKDEKLADLGLLYKLFQDTPKSLEYISDVFKKHM
jgi:hypothetical protein